MDIILEKEKEAFAYANGGLPPLLRVVLFQEESFKSIVNRLKPDSVELTKSCSSLLLYRLVDAVAFSNGCISTSSIAPRGEFSNFTIAVRSSILCLVLEINILKLNLSRAGRHSVQTGLVSCRRLELYYTKFGMEPLLENLVLLLRLT